MVARSLPALLVAGMASCVTAERVPPGRLALEPGVVEAQAWVPLDDRGAKLDVLGIYLPGPDVSTGRARVMVPAAPGLHLYIASNERRFAEEAVAFGVEFSW